MFAPASPPSGEYGAPGAGPSLEEQQICVDVSSYLPLVWREEQAEQCTTDFVQNCEEREERVCGEVTETLCEVTRTIYFPPFFMGSLSDLVT